MYKNESETADFLDLTERLIISTKEEHGNDFVVFALDSINSLYTLINTEKPKDIRKRIYYFFKLLRDNDLTSFIIKETPKPIGSLYGEGFDEAYLVVKFKDERATPANYYKFQVDKAGEETELTGEEAAEGVF